MNKIIQNIVPIKTPDRVGQATAIEQSRAVAEVQASIVVARQYPRDTQRAMAAMGESCAMKGLAERAFYRFNRGGSTISGLSIQLARDLARVWGNISYGVKELSRDDVHGQSEMLAYAWDIETNARSETVFIVPHKRDKTGGPQKLTDMRDIYENNANNGARRLRECIVSILPPWFVDEAKTLCTKTLEDKADGLPLVKRVALCVEAFAGMSIRQELIEKKLGRATTKWDLQDVVHLGVILKSIKRGEISKEEEFGPDQKAVTAADIKGQEKVESGEQFTFTGEDNKKRSYNVEGFREALCLFLDRTTNADILDGVWKANGPELERYRETHSADAQHLTEALMARRGELDGAI